MSRASSARNGAEATAPTAPQGTGPLRTLGAQWANDGRVRPIDDDTRRDPAPPTARRQRRLGLFLVVAAAVLTLDVVSKVLVVANLGPYDRVRILGGAIYLQQARNSGAAFSLGTGFTVILSLVALAVVAVIVRTASRMRSIGWAVALGLILGGALGNVTDRIPHDAGVFRGG